MSKPKTEAAADDFVQLGERLGLTRQEMAIVCGTLFANHAVATGVPVERGHLLVDAFWAMRAASPPDTKVLVREPTRTWNYYKDRDGDRREST